MRITDFTLSIDSNGDVVVDTSVGKAVISKYNVINNLRVSNSTLGIIDVLKIKNSLKKGASKKDVANLYGVSIRTVFRIAAGDTFGWINTN